MSDMAGVVIDDKEDKHDSKNFCFGCLCDKNERDLQYYTFHCAALKYIIKTEHLLLCYMCERMARYTERFIQNVHSNQILLENFNNIMDDTLKSVRLQIQPVVNHNQMLCNVIELSGSDCDSIEEETFSVIFSSNLDKKVKVEIDMKEESADLVDNSDDFINGDDAFTDIDVKDEELQLIEVLKQEIANENLSYIKDENSKITDMPKIKMIHLTRKQCDEERLRMANDRRYLNSMYKCTYCIKGFTCKGVYDIHMEKHNQCMGEYECDICKQRMDTKEKLISHVRYHEIRYKCIECDYIRKCKHSVRNHYSAEHLSNVHQYICTKCTKTYTHSSALRRHNTFVHGFKERVQCAYCSRTYCTKDVLRSHMLLKHAKEISAPEVTKKCVCTECGQSFKSPSQLRYHSAKHSDKRDFYCVECDKSFKTNYSLRTHLNTAAKHVDNKELPLACSHCDKRFSTRRDVTRHTNRIHLNVKPYACDKCDKGYANLWGLKDHQRFTHEGYKRPLQFACPMCDKVFTRGQILKSHIRTHTGERPYQCSKCPANFNQRSTLRTHDKLIHHKLTRSGRSKGTAKK